MPAPQGQTFAVVPVGGMAASGGLEFQRYAAIVAQQLAARGYTPAPDPASASMVVQLGYGVDHGQVRVLSDPFARPYGYGGFYGGSFFYPRFGRFGSPFYYGWADPFWYGDGSTPMSNIIARSISTSAPRAPSSPCSTDAPRRARKRTA